MKNKMIKVTFVYDQEIDPPTVHHNTRNGGRIAWTTKMKESQTFDSILQKLYKVKGSCCTAEWFFFFNQYVAVNRDATPLDVGYGDGDEITITCDAGDFILEVD